MAQTRRKFTREFKLRVLREIAAGKSPAQASREHEIHPTMIGPGRKEQTQYREEAFAGNGPAEASREHEIHPTMIGQWRKEQAKYGEEAFAGNGRTYKDEARIAELERKVGQMTMENDLLKKVLAAMETPRPQPGRGRG